MTEINDTYWLGYRHGRRVQEYAGHLVDHEPAMREELRLIGTSVRRHRAFALGEIRGYRQAQDQPRPRPDDRWHIQRP